MKAAHSVVLGLVVCLLVSWSSALRAAENAGGDADDWREAMNRRLEPIARDVQALEQLETERLFWIRLLDRLGRKAPDAPWFTGFYVPGMRDPNGVFATGAVKERLGTVGIESAEDAAAGWPRLEARFHATEGVGADVTLARDAEAFRKALVEHAPFVHDAQVMIMAPGKEVPGSSRVVYRIELKPSQPPKVDVPGGKIPSAAEVEAAYAELRTLLLAWWDNSVYDPKRAPRQPALFLGELQDILQNARTLAKAKSVKLGAGVENLGFEELATGIPPAEVTLDMLKERSGVRDILLLLINRNVESIESIERLRAVGDAGDVYRKLRFSVTFRAKWPALARFMLDLVNKTKVAVDPFGELPRNLLVIEEMSYLADEPAAREEPARPAAGFGGGRPIGAGGAVAIRPRHGRNEPAVVGRAPDNNVLTVAMTIALIDFSESITGPVGGADEANGKAVKTEDTAAVHEADGASANEAPVDETSGDEVFLDVVNPRALARDIAVLTASVNGDGLPEGFVLRDPTSELRLVMPLRGEVACEVCGWIRPENVVRCPACGYVQLADDDKDGMPNEWEDRYESVDRYAADAAKDGDGDGFTNLKEYLGGSNPDDPKSIPSPFRLMGTYRKPVDILFRGHTIKEGGKPDVIDPGFWVLRMHFGRDSDAAFIPLNGWWHGFKLGPLEKTEERRSPGGGIPDYTEDVYTLTIQRPGQEPIKLVKDKWATFNETYVDLAVTRGRDKGKTFKGTAIGVDITVNGTRYMVTEAGDAGVVIKDSDGATYTLR